MNTPTLQPKTGGPGGSGKDKEPPCHLPVDGYDAVAACIAERETKALCGMTYIPKPDHGPECVACIVCEDLNRLRD